MKPLLLVTVALTWILQSDATTNRRKRSNTDNFNILLSIYKMNPLKHSKVFKTFSNRILLPKPDEQIPDLNYNSNESPTKQNGTNAELKPIEELPDAPHKLDVDRPLYVNENGADIFNPGRFLDKLLSNNKVNINNDDAEVLINRINHRKNKSKNLKSNASSNTLNHRSKKFERISHLKVFNLNEIDNNEVSYDDADVIVVK